MHHEPELNGKGGADRREFPRAELWVCVDMTTPHGTLTGMTRDVSRGGLFVATEEELGAGERVQVRFSIPGAEVDVIEAEAEVMWRRADARGRRGPPQGLGLRFLNLPEDAAREIDCFVEPRSSSFA